MPKCSPIHFAARDRLIDALIIGYLAIVEAIEIDTLPGNTSKNVAGIHAVIHITRRIERHRCSVVGKVDILHREADIGAAIIRHPEPGGVPHLNGVASNGVDSVVVNRTIRLPRGACIRMRPDTVPNNPRKIGVTDFKTAAALFQKNPAGRIVVAVAIERSGIFNRHEIDQHFGAALRIIGNARIREIRTPRIVTFALLRTTIPLAV